MNAFAGTYDFKTRKLSHDEVQALIDHGFMDEKAPFELIDGVLIEMPTEGINHADWKLIVNTHCILTLDRTKYVVAPDTTLHLGPYDNPEPDMYVFDRSKKLGQLKGSDVLLVLEVAHSSLKKDTEFKTGYYAGWGIQEYWVFDVEVEQMLIYRDPKDGAYQDTVTYGLEDVITCGTVDGLSLRLADLERLS